MSLCAIRYGPTTNHFKNLPGKDNQGSMEFADYKPIQGDKSTLGNVI